MTEIVLIAAFALAGVVVADMRVRKRVLECGGAAPGRLTRIAARLDRTALVGLSVGFAYRGVVGAWAGLIAGIAWSVLRQRRASAALSTRLDEQAPAFVRSLAANLRAGRSVEQGLDATRLETTEPLRERVTAACGRLAAGRPRGEVLGLLEAETPGRAMPVVTETLRIGANAARSLPEILDFIAEGLTERVRLERDRRAGTAQARLSAIVVGVMPLAFLAITSGSDAAPARMLVTEPAGWLLLVVGLGLEGLGALWVRQVMRS